MAFDGSIRNALFLGHPGHELRVLGWATRVRPLVAVLTDGSGSEGRSRIPLTRDVLATIGCESVEVRNGLSDADMYTAILAGDTSFFLDLAQRLSDLLHDNCIDCVVSDGVEGYNPTHDLCAAMVGCAARLCSKRSGRRVSHYTFPLVGPAIADPVPASAILVELGALEVEQKLELSRRYAAMSGGALVEEVEEMIDRLGVSGFVREMLLPAQLERDFAPFMQQPPFYEAYGQKKVEAGLYPVAIRYLEHMAPILDALRAA